MQILLGQRDSEWNLKKLGFGTGTIGQYGCVITSCSMGMRARGYDISPLDINEAVKAVSGFIGETKNLLDWLSLEKIFNGVINYIGSYNYDTVPAPINTLKQYLNEGKIVILRVSAANIGGRGDHFMLAWRVEGDNVVVLDPWYREEAFITKRYTKDWADTATEIITGFRVMEIKPNTSGGNSNMQDDEMIIKKSDFENLVQKATQADKVAGFFSFDPKTTFADKVIELYKQAVADKESAQKSLNSKTQELSEVIQELATCSKVSGDRKKQYDNLIEYLATKLMTTEEEAVIKAELDELLNVEEKLRVATKKIEDEREAHEIEKKKLQGDILQLKQELADARTLIDTLETRLETLGEKIDNSQQEENKISAWEKVIQDIANFFAKIARVTNKKLDAEEKKLDEEK